MQPFRNTIKASEASEADQVWISRQWDPLFMAEFRFIVSCCGLANARLSTLKTFGILLASTLHKADSEFITFPKTSQKHRQYDITPNQVASFVRAMAEAGLIVPVWKQQQSYRRANPKPTVYKLSDELRYQLGHMIE